MHTFEQSISSFGLDFAWPMILKNPKIGIVDCIEMHHTGVIDQTNGPFYTYLRSINVDPAAEFEKIMHAYGFSSGVNGRVKLDQRAAQNVATLGLG